MKHRVSTFIMIFFGVGKVFAQSDSLSEKQEKQKHLQLQEVSIQVIRAERTWPVTETLLGEKQIERNYTGQEMPVILARTPSVNWYSDGGNYTGYMYMRLRGIDQTRVNFTLNGVPLNEPEDQGAYFSNYPDFLNSIRSIQVQRGVGISTNGTASFAGSVNLESPSLYDSAYVELSSSYGSYNTYRLSPEFNTGLLKNNWSFYGRYSNTGSDGFREHSGTRGQSFFFSGGYTAKRTVLKFTGFTGMSNNQMAYLAMPDSVLRHNYRANSLTKDEKDDFRQSLVMGQVTHELSPHSTLNASVYYTYLQGGYSILFAPDLYRYSVKSDFYGATINYRFTKQRWNISTGINANNYVRYHSSALLPYEDALLYKNAGYKNEASAFLKATYTVQRFMFFADVQYRAAQFRYQPDKPTGIGASSVSWAFFNPKAGISYRIKQHLLYVSIGQTGREPTRNDLFAGYDNMDSTNLAEIGDFKRVNPESVTDIEAGIKLWFPHYKIDLNVYHMEFRNEIAAIGQLSYIGLPLRKNVASSYRRGIELNMILEPLRRLELSTQANLSLNRIRSYTTDYDSVTYTNVQPLLTPQVILNQSLAYRVTTWLSVAVGARYLSSAFLDNTNDARYKVPESLIAHASIDIRFFRQHSLSFTVNNLFDQPYYTSGYVQGSEPYYFAMATRNYFVTLKLRF